MEISKPWLLYSLFLIVISIQEVLCRKIVEHTKIVKPQIDFTSYLEGEEYDWIDGNHLEGIEYNDTVFFIPTDVVILLLNCYANYPVEFLFEPLNPQLKFDSDYYFASNFRNLRYYRKALDLNKPSTYTFGVTSLIQGRSTYVTGNYICQSVENPSYRTNMNIFWGGNPPPYFTNSGSSQKVTTYDTNGKIILPCILSVRQDEIGVNILRQMNVTKENNETSLEFVDIRNSPGINITYDAFRGYMVNFSSVSTNDSGLGIYKCIAEDVDDFVQIEVISDLIQKTPPFKEIENGAAHASFDAKTNTLACCSNSDEPPKLQIQACTSIASCNFAAKYLQAMDLTWKPDYYSVHNESCAMYQTHRYGESVMQFRCIGDGIDIVRRIIYPVELYPNGTFISEAYSEWENIIPEKMIYFYPVNQSSDLGYGYFDIFNPYTWRHREGMIRIEYQGNFYAGQNISFRCETSQYYFADGSKIVVKFMNSMEAVIPAITKFDPEEFVRMWFLYDSIFMHQVSLILDTSMTGVTCYAPVYNSNKWVTKTYSFKVRNPVLPSINGDRDESIFLTLNSTEIQELRCELAQGDPLPTLQFMRQGKVLVDDTIFSLKTTNTSITLSFTHAVYNVHGDYLCVASNFAGNYTKTFHVYIDEPHPWTETIIIIVIVIVLASVIGLVLWKIKSQRSTVIRTSTQDFSNRNTFG